MKPWMLQLVLPLGLPGAVVLVVVFNQAAPLVAAGLGVLAVPLLWRLRFGPPGDEDDTNYWRIKRL